MKTRTSVALTVGILTLAAGLIVVAAQGGPAATVLAKTEKPALSAKPTPTTSPASSATPTAKTAPLFQPPSEQDMPKDEFGKTVKMGQDIFEHTERYASQYVGKNSSLNCSSCHLDGGRLAHSAPLWAAYVSYPAYRSKNKHVNTFPERLQGCFKYSMNGKAPPLGDPVLVALESYAYWLASGAPIDPKIAGRGYPKVPSPPLPRDYARGQQVFEQHCAVCHGADGAGQPDANGQPNFPALWGAKSFNWGAGMGSLKNASGFIKANMPLGLGGSLSDQQAWDVATFMNSHERPQDPRFKGSIADTRAKYHDSPDDLYGTTVNGQLLGQGTPPDSQGAKK
ncbi:MAG TPA: c-type cytochrome [Thiobacillus sp.]|nr:MAG: cytochrome C [Hydrogenophilales bacterium 16-61-112]OZA51112.1 MAG: cytochrome C [Hydrogenophilales bacterium 17-61-76]HQT31695.1 c-type cytochrome [Thiobacillus sp.]HQT71200.1 c-type cytochrome [Thiobacillus sp.]